MPHIYVLRKSLKYCDVGCQHTSWDQYTESAAIVPSVPSMDTLTIILLYL